MSSVILQIGQCGNQIGQELWKLLEQDAENHKGLVYCNHDGFFRSVNVDSEPKVIKRMLMGNERSHTYREANIVIGRNGRGSNWAFGYNGNEKDVEHSLLNQTREIIRKEVERCSSYSGIICLHSLAGGTGSGLGSRLIETLRDDYPMNYILSCAITPYSLGENPLQHYNMLLSLATLQRTCDGILLFDNDDVLRRLQRIDLRSQLDPDQDDGSMRSKAKSVSMKQVNQHIASNIAGLILPTDSLIGSSAVSIGMEPWDLVRSLCSIPTYKFMRTNFVCRSKLSWPDLTSSLLGAVKGQSSEGNAFSSIANLLVARGEAYPTFPSVLQSMEEKVKSAVHPVSWNPFPLDVWTASVNPFRPADSLSLTMASNSCSILPLLENTLLKARQKFDVGAYLHWYHRYNCQREDFEMAFSELDSVIGAYREASL